MASGATPRAALSPWVGIGNLILPMALIASVLVILVPLPAALMDVLLAANIAIAVIVLLTTIYVRTPLEFSIFPTLLLVTTLARLVLNVATTRLILTQADQHGMLAAGKVVKSFGEFVAGDKIVVGLIIFAIIVVIQFVVITKGATRISEVAARFALDGLPGRQMAIDADLNAGLIDQGQAQRRRQQVAEQADFFGAMDGASKFVRGDAIAGIVITLINILGGLVIGVFQNGMELTQAASLFTKLTIGDGLVTQVPALLISLAAGLLVTRSTASANLPLQFMTQLFSHPQALAVTAGFLAVLVFTSLPTTPLLAIGGGCIGLAITLNRRQQAADVEAARQADAGKKTSPPRVEDSLLVDPMEVEIGVGLIRLADPRRGGDLLERIQRVRQNVAAELGFIMPKVRIRDNVRLDQNQYRIKIADIPVAEGTIHPNKVLAVGTNGAAARLNGLAGRDPASDAPATWIDPADRERAQIAGLTVLEPSGVVTLHLAEVVRRSADEILNRDATKHLVEELRKTSPAVVEELIPNQMTLAQVQQVLQMLLREQIPIRQLGPILETLGEHAARTNDPLLLAELVRRRLARALCARYRDPDGRLLLVTLDPTLEDQIRAGLEHTDRGLVIRLAPQVIEGVCRKLAVETAQLIELGLPPVLLTSPPIRAAVKQITAASLPRLVVLSYDEITRDTRIESIGMITA